MSINTPSDPWNHPDLVLNSPQVTPPTKDPASTYPAVPGITYDLFRLPPAGFGCEQHRAALRELEAYQAGQKAHFLGYQANQRLDFEHDLSQYLNYHINNIGDPFQSGNFTVNSKWMERAVMDYYASLWNARWPHDPKDPESYWGYVVSMGCTEGNIYGLWNGRDCLAGKFLLDDSTATSQAVTSGETTVTRHRLIFQQALPTTGNPNAYAPIAFYSDDTHYSIVKAMQMLEVSTFYEIGSKLYPKDNPLEPGQPWPKEVPSKGGNSGPGSIDVNALAKLVEFFAARGYPILISLNYGTTFKGAYDDVENVGNTLLPIFRRYGLDERKVYYDPNDPTRFDRRTGYWIHVDGALGAAYMPFIEMAYQSGLIKQRGPNFDFRLSFVHSLSMSGHKWIGAPWPCGIYMTKVKFQLRPPDDPEYIGAQDTTFAGSRNGFSPMIFWDYLAKNSYARQVSRALYTEELAAYAHQELIELGKRIAQDIWVERSPLSLTIRFKAVKKELIFKYSLSGETLIVNGKTRRYNHIFIMPFGSKELIDQFIRELSRPGAFPSQNEEAVYEPEARAGATRLAYFPRHGRGFK